MVLKQHCYILKPVIGNARYTKLRVEECRNMGQSLQKAFVNLEDVTLCLSKDGYKGILRLADNFAAFNQRLKYAQHRPHVPIKVDARSWWKYAYNVVTNQMKAARKKTKTQGEDGAGHQRRRRGKRLGKEIYASLCHPNPFDDGTKMFWQEKYKGGVCMSMSSKALSITGIDDRRYWNYIPTEESSNDLVAPKEFSKLGTLAEFLSGPDPHGRFHTVAYLQQIWWFEVDGEIEFCFPAGVYSLFFRLQLGRVSKRLGRRICNPEHIHGWDIKPVRFQLSTSAGQHNRTQCFLDGPGSWIHYPVGDFVVENSDVPTKIKFSMTQIDCTHTKGGLCVDSVLIYPSGVRPEKVFVNDR